MIMINDHYHDHDAEYEDEEEEICWCFDSSEHLKLLRGFGKHVESDTLRKFLHHRDDLENQ